MSDFYLFISKGGAYDNNLRYRRMFFLFFTLFFIIGISSNIFFCFTAQAITGNMWTANKDNSSVSKITATGTVTEYSLNHIMGLYPDGIAFDGTNMWTANGGNNSVSKITATGTVTVYTLNDDNASPDGIAFDGTNMWTANYLDTTVSKITPTGTVTEYSLNDDNATPTSIAFDGTNMWTANYGDSSVSKITPTGTVTEYSLNDDSANPEGIAFDGTNMWTANPDDSSVSKITPNGTVTEYSLNDTNAYPNSIAFDGTNMWTANGGDNSVSKITPNGTVTEYSLNDSSTDPDAIAFDGTNMWTANVENNSVSKITPNGTVTEYSLNDSSTAPGAIAFDGRTLYPPPPSLLPSITAFSASSSIVASAGTSTLSWSITNASSIAIAPGSFSTSTLVGSITVNPTSTAAYTITATNVNGTTTATTSVSVATAPTTPGSFTVGSPATSTLSLSWTSSTPNNGATIAFYTIYRGLSSTTISNFIATTTSGSYLNSALAASTTYWYTITAQDSVGNISASSTNASAMTLSGIVTSTPSNNEGTVSVATGGGGSAYSLTINGGALSTNTIGVTLSLYGTEAYTMEISNTANFANSTWIPYVTSLPWMLASSTGVETVFVQFRSISGNIIGNAEATIDLTPASSVTPATPPSTTGMSVPQLENLLASLEAELQTVKAEGESQTPAAAPALPFIQNLQFGMTGSDVKQLQLFLIQEDIGPAAQLLKTYGSTGNFGPLTLAALVELQKKEGVVPTSGYFGPITRAWVNAHNSGLF